MTTWMWALIMFIIIQRLIELVIAKRNERWMKERGAIEVGEKHYKWFIILHVSFFISIILEASLTNIAHNKINYSLLFIFAVVQIARVWCIQTLGRFWNTKIIVLPRVSPIKKGPYKYLKHPNYLIVGIELFIIPIMFHAYISAFIFPILHLLLLRIRIPSENKALTEKPIPIIR